MIDELSPPGMLTSKGACLAISNYGELYAQHGRHVVTLELEPLNWQLFGVALAKIRTDGHKGAIRLEVDKGAVELQKYPRGMIRMFLTKRGGMNLTLYLTRREVDYLSEAIHLRRPSSNEGA